MRAPFENRPSVNPKLTRQRVDRAQLPMVVRKYNVWTETDNRIEKA